MASNDDALAATALALNEEAKAGRRKPAAKKTETPPPAEQGDGRATFTLKDFDADDFHAATDGGPIPLAKFWKRMGAAHGFDSSSVEVVDAPEGGDVSILAMPKQAGVNDPIDEDDAEPYDAEEAQSRGLEMMERAVSDMQLASSTLVGDITAGLLNVVQNLQKPFSAHSQHEKRDLVAKLEHIAQLVARKSVDIVAADDRITVKAIVEKINIGDKVQIGLKLGAMPEDEQAEAIQNLFHCQKKSVLIVTADADRHMGKRREHVEPDEDELPFDAGSDADPDADDDAE